MKKLITILIVAATVIAVTNCGEKYVMKRDLEKSKDIKDPIVVCRKAKFIEGKGSSIDDPIVMKAQNPEYALDCQLQYISKLECGKNGNWSMIDSEYTNHNENLIKKITTRCSETDRTNVFYFEVSEVEELEIKDK